MRTMRTSERLALQDETSLDVRLVSLSQHATL
jgi:hypothetical protein